MSGENSHGIIQKNQKDIFLQKQYYSFLEMINIPV
jgi:hypothetical protein